MPWTALDSAILARFLRETAAATWKVDRDGYVLDVPEWTALTGQTADEAEGDGWMDALHPEDVERVKSAWQTAVAHATHYNTDYRLRCADGAFRWFNARGVPIFTRDGDVEAWVGVILAIPGASRPSRTSAPSEAIALADRFDDISPAALRAARAILNWTTERLAEEAGVARSTLRRLEGEDSSATPRRASVHKILRVLASQQLYCLGRGTRVIGVVDPSERDNLNDRVARNGQTKSLQ